MGRKMTNQTFRVSSEFRSLPPSTLSPQRLKRPKTAEISRFLRNELHL